MNTRVCKKEIKSFSCQKRSLDKVLENFSTEAKAKILHMREIHACLMELPRQRMNWIQYVALYRNYQSGESKKRCLNPMTNDYIFKYINEIK